MAASQTSATKKITIDFTQGVATFGNPYELGPRIVEMRNYINKYIPMKSGEFIDFGVGQSWEPMRPFLASGIQFNDCSFIGAAEQFENTETNLSGAGFLFGGTQQDNTLNIWNQAGAKVSAGLASGPGAWSIAHFSSITPPTTYLTEPNLTDMLYTTDRAAFNTYTPTGFSGVADHLIVHQGRIWLAQGKNLFFTDAFDPMTVRQFGQINPVVVPMDITGLSRIGISEVDPGAQSHLFIGGTSQIWIYDGSPGSGNEVLRRYTDQVGLSHIGTSAMAQTDRGLVFSGSDRNLYLCPPGGAAGPFAIGAPIRNHLSAGIAYLTYRRPYLMVFLKNANWWYCDLRGEQPAWYGPNRSIDEVFINTFISFKFTSRYPNQDYIWLAGNTGSDAYLYKVQDVSYTAEELTQQILKTGAINEPGHEVVFGRAYFTFELANASKTFTFICENNKPNETFTRQFTVPGGPSGTTYNVVIPITSPAAGTRGDFIKCQLKCEGADNASDPAMAFLQVWEIEYDIIKRSKV